MSDPTHPTHRPPIRFGPPPAAPPHPASYAPPAEDGARMLAVAVLVLSVLHTALTVLAEVPLNVAAVDLARRDPTSDLVAYSGAALSFAAVALLLPLWILTSLWLRAERARLGPPRSFHHGTAGTFWSWVVPVVNLVWPFRVVREVHERAVEPARQVSLGAWWTLWLLSLLVYRVNAGLFEAQGYGQPAGAVVTTGVLQAGLLVAALAYWVAIVRTTSRLRT